MTGLRQTMSHLKPSRVGETPRPGVQQVGMVLSEGRWGGGWVEVGGVADFPHPGFRGGGRGQTFSRFRDMRRWLRDLRGVTHIWGPGGAIA